jgi:hypothetical protein
LLQQQEEASRRKKTARQTTRLRNNHPRRCFGTNENPFTAFSLLLILVSSAAGGPRSCPRHQLNCLLSSAVWIL